MKLTDTHLVLLSAAVQSEARLLPRPDRIRDKAAHALATRFLRAGLAEEVPVRSDQPHWRADDDALVGLRITREGLAAIGVSEDHEPSAPPPESEMEPRPSRAPRAGSKQAAILALLGREEGASLADLIAATGWLPHTTRAALTGLRQRGFMLARSKGEDGRTLYRVRSTADALDSSNEA
jgi:hypothetical protein